jgi:hypothetical protein
VEEIKSRIKAYILNEVSVIWDPKYPRKEYTFLNLSEKVDLLFRVLEFAIDESYFDGLAETFYTSTANILDSEPGTYLNTTEQLVIAFERFVKKVAFLRFSEYKIWHGNNQSVGIKESSLQGIFNRTLDKKYRNRKKEYRFSLHAELVQYTGLRKRLLDVMTSDFMTELYAYPGNARTELVHYFNLALGCYLMVTEDNFHLLYKSASPISHYLEEVVHNEADKSLPAKYVELFCERVIDPAGMVGQARLYDLADEQNTETVDYNPVDDMIGGEPSVDTVGNLFSSENNFVLIGDAGSGKTTTLRYFFHKYALEAYNRSSPSTPIPVFIRANECHTESPFHSIIDPGVQKGWVLKALQEGRLIFFIDGLNEIDEDLKLVACSELHDLMTGYPSCRFIISARGNEFALNYGIQAYKLQALKDDQIWNFIKRRITKDAETIYRQITENEALFELAHNPLILRIIVSVSAGDDVPQNKGLLYDTFITSLCSIEKGNHPHLVVQTKIDILSQVALWFRNNKKMSVPVDEFKGILKRVFDALDISFHPGDFIDEISNSLIIQVNRQNVSFYHESYLDFLCAKAILRTFRELRYIDPAFLGRKWYPVLIMCSDLTYPDKIAKDFARFFFNGAISHKQNKPLQLFTPADFNEHLLIACKIAYNLRSCDEDIYLEAEQYLGNTLSLWLWYFLKYKTEPLPVEILFASVAALNSEKLISRVLSQDKWISLWLLNINYEKYNSTDGPAENTLTLTHAFHHILKKYSRNCPDFTLTYKLIRQRRQLLETWFFASVDRHLLYFSNYLLQTVPVRFLIKQFEEEPSFDILLNIISRDFTWLCDNFDAILTSGIIDKAEFFYEVIKTYPDRRKSWELIFEHSHMFEKDQHEFHKIVRHSVCHNEACEPLMTYLDGLMGRNFFLFKNLLFHIRKVAWDSLSEKIRNFFQSSLPDNVKVKYTLDHADVNAQSFFIIVDDSYNHLFEKKSGTKIRFNNDDEYHIINLFNPRTTKRFHVILCASPDEISLSKIKPEGELHYLKNGDKFIFSYLFYELSATGRFLRFFLDNTIYDHTYKFPKMRHSSHMVYDDIELILWGRSQQVKSDKTNELELEISGPKPSEKILQDGEFEIIETDKERFFDRSDYTEFHPETLIRLKMMDELRTRLDEERVQAFIRKAGISYFFADKLNVRLGLITSVNNEIATIFCFDSQSHIFKPVPIGRQVQVADIVVIGDDESIFRPAQNVDEKLPFIEGNIVVFEDLKQSGYIRNDETTRDYMFFARSCNYIPLFGDRVKFLVMKDYKPGYEGLSMAVLISKVSAVPKTCVILSSHMAVSGDIVIGYARDTETNQKLGFLLSANTCQHIRNLTGIPLPGNQFNYIISRIHPTSSISNCPRIRLVQFLQEERKI